jgi:hypothetical protein
MPAGVDFGGYVRVVGVAPLPQEAQPGETIVVRTYWRSIATANGSVGSAVPDLWVIVALQQPDGTVVGRAEARLGTTLYPSSVWQPDDIVLSDVPIQLAGELSRPALAAAWLGVRAETADLLATGSGGDSFGLGQVAIRPDAPCSPQVPTQVDFGGQIRLQGYRLESGGLTLCWTALRAPAADYTVFVHILDASGTQVGGADGPPVGGQYPTSAWTPGETVTDWRALEWPPGAAVEIGLYVLASGERLVIDGTAETGFRLPR